MVLSCVDADLLAEALGVQRLTVRALAAHLALDEETVNKTVRSRADDLLCGDWQEQLRYAVADGDEWVDRVEFEVERGDRAASSGDVVSNRDVDGVFVDGGDGTPILIDEHARR